MCVSSPPHSGCTGRGSWTPAIEALPKGTSTGNGNPPNRRTEKENKRISLLSQESLVLQAEKESRLSLLSEIDRIDSAGESAPGADINCGADENPTQDKRTQRKSGRRRSIVPIGDGKGGRYFFDDPKLGGSGETSWDLESLDADLADPVYACCTSDGINYWFSDPALGGTGKSAWSKEELI